MSERIRVCESSELPPGERTIINAGGRSIGVFNYNGQYYALENRCAHKYGPVCNGKLQGALKGEFLEPGLRVREYFDEEIPAISCPWHGWEYDLRTGTHLGDPDYSIPSYDVIEENGELFVEL